ncbi:MAG: FAD:protein transferase, partial [Actinomycetota bacterium]|nr:FAD:protein transferase [Actinomycetota bacterium]
GATGASGATKNPAPTRRAWAEQVMGMPVSIHLRGRGSRSAEAESRVQAAYDELRAVDVLFSPYLWDSEVSRIDRGELRVEDAHQLVAEVVALCATAAVLTGGSFDAFYLAGEAAPGRRGFDPSGLVKGWAVQRAAEHLAAGLGCDVSVNAGGDIAVRPGTDPLPWRIGIEDPADPARVLAVLPLTQGGVATSGTARRGLHLVDPASGRTVADALSVTVVGPSLLWADVLATAAFVRGPVDGLAMVEALTGYEALVVAGDGALTTTSGLRGADPRDQMLTGDMSG